MNVAPHMYHRLQNQRRQLTGVVQASGCALVVLTVYKNDKKHNYSLNIAKPVEAFCSSNEVT